MLVICFYFLADLADLMQPSLVAPVVAWLCHEDCRDNGSVIEAAGGWAGKCEWLDFCIQMKFYLHAICRRYLQYYWPN